MLCHGKNNEALHFIPFPFLFPIYTPLFLHEVPCGNISLKQTSLKTVSAEGNLKKTTIVLEDELFPAVRGYVNATVA